MPAQFPLSAVLGLRDNLTRPALRAFDRVKDAGIRAGKRVSKSFSGKNLAKGIGEGLSGAGGLLGLGSVAGIMAAGAQVVDFEKTLQGLSTQAGYTTGQVDDLRKRIDQVSLQTGMARDEVLAMADTIINLEGAAGFSAEKMELLARASVAANAPAEDLAKVMFSLNASFFDGEGKAADMEGALSAVIQAGKEGSIPLNEMAQVLQQVSSEFDDFSQAGKNGAAELAAALQVMRTSFGGASEAGTGLSALVGNLTRDAGKLKKLSKGAVRVFETKNGVKTLRSLNAILDDIAKSELWRDPELLAKAFGSKEALKAVRALIEQREKYDELALAARNSNAVQEDFNKNINSQSGRLSKAMNELKNSIAQAFTPEVLEAFALVLGNVAQTIGWVVTKIADAAKLADRLADWVAEQEGKRQREMPQLLLEQARAFGRGEIAGNQRENLARRGFDESQFSAAAARQILDEARSRDLIRDGAIDKEALANLDLHAFDALDLQRGLERALEISSAAPAELVPASRERAIEQAFANPERPAPPMGPQFPTVVPGEDMRTLGLEIWQGMLDELRRQRVATEQQREEIRRQREATERLERAQIDRGRR